jgi:hypothetical protein
MRKKSRQMGCKSELRALLRASMLTEVEKAG